MEDLEHLIHKTESHTWDNQPPMDTLSASQLILLGKIISQCYHSLNSLKGATGRSWIFVAHLVIKELEPNVILFEFQKPEDCARVLKRCPWNIKGNVLVAKLWEPGLSWREVDLNSPPIWLQIHGLPMDRSNEASARSIGSAVGEVLRIEGDSSARIWCVPFIRV